MIQRYLIAVIVAMLVGVFSARDKITGEEASRRFSEVTAAPMPANVQVMEMTEWNVVRGSIAGLLSGIVAYLILHARRRKSSGQFSDGSIANSPNREK